MGVWALVQARLTLDCRLRDRVAVMENQSRLSYCWSFVTLPTNSMFAVFGLFDPTSSYHPTYLHHTCKQQLLFTELFFFSNEVQLLKHRGKEINQDTQSTKPPIRRSGIIYRDKQPIEKE